MEWIEDIYGWYDEYGDYPWSPECSRVLEYFYFCYLDKFTALEAMKREDGLGHR
jgi:hypothetical protein